MPVHIPDPMELVEFGEEVVINQHAHFLIGNGLHYFDHHPDAAPRQNSNRRPCWEMRCTLCRNKGHLFSKCSYKQAAPICTYCCRQGHIALRCNLRLDMNIELFSRGFVSMPIDPNDTQALAMDLPAGYVPARFGQPGHLDYRAAPFVEALQAQEQMLNEQAPNEVVTPVEAQQILPADMPLALLEPIGLQLPTANETAPIEAVAPISDGEGSQPQPPVWIDPQLVAEIDAVLDRSSESEVIKLKSFNL